MFKSQESAKTRHSSCCHFYRPKHTKKPKMHFEDIKRYSIINTTPVLFTPECSDRMHESSVASTNPRPWDQGSSLGDGYQYKIGRKFPFQYVQTIERQLKPNKSHGSIGNRSISELKRHEKRLSQPSYMYSRVSGDITKPENLKFVKKEVYINNLDPEIQTNEIEIHSSIFNSFDSEKNQSLRRKNMSE